MGVKQEYVLPPEYEKDGKVVVLRNKM